MFMSLPYKVTRQRLTVPAAPLRRETSKEAKLQCCGKTMRSCAANSRSVSATSQPTGSGSLHCRPCHPGPR
ncbi:hypothetical protein A8926_6625 [Saccharopolyspora spinosa]|uniref:Uncharacterized protein n=1 Tax=Saccharopolyspora spinosa TaxID=60894 RepID=A0A2N3Y6N1_SACSN|nr:hypothetical protein A8926_6625 [Saccharopolyspora spinosa]